MYLFEKTLFLKWVKNTIIVAVSTALLTLLIVSFTGYAYSRYRFSGRKASLMGIMLVQAIPAFAGITAFYTIHAIVSSIIPTFSRTTLLILIYAGGAIASNIPSLIPPTHSKQPQYYTLYFFGVYVGTMFLIYLLISSGSFST